MQTQTGRSFGLDDVIAAVEDVLQCSDASFTYEDAPVRSHMFFARKIPPVSAKDYILRLHWYSRCSESALVIALIYLEQALSSYRKDCPAFQYTRQNIHRYLIAALLSAIKTQEDIPDLNSFYAIVAGITLAELNALEISFLKELGWSTFVDPKDYDDFIARCWLSRRGRVDALEAASTVGLLRKRKCKEQDEEEEEGFAISASSSVRSDNIQELVTQEIPIPKYSTFTQ